jgi:hypothetical protein
VLKVAAGGTASPLDALGSLMYSMTTPAAYAQFEGRTDPRPQCQGLGVPDTVYP